MKTKANSKPKKHGTEGAAWVPTKPVLVLRTCSAEMKGYGEFQWPTSGYVEAPDWNPEPKCGGGLHGLAWGLGSASYLDTSDDANWLIIESDESEVVCIEGDKHKTKQANVLFVGAKDEAIKFLYSHELYPATNTVGVFGTSTSGDGGTISILLWNGNRYKAKVASVKDEDGEGELLPNTKYQLDTSGAFVVVKTK